MKIERLYYTVEQLSEHWGLSVDDIMQLGLTNQLQFVARADWGNPDIDKIYCGAHTPITFEALSNIYFATEPFSETGICECAKNRYEIGQKVVITYYPGTERLIIQADEVDRFEREMSGKMPTEQENSPIIEETNDEGNEIEEIGRALKEQHPDATTTDLLKYAEELAPFKRGENNTRRNKFITNCLVNAGIPVGKRGVKAKSPNHQHAQ